MNVRVRCTVMLGERTKMKDPQTPDNSTSGFIVLCAARSSILPEGEQRLSARPIVHNSEPSCSGLHMRTPAGSRPAQLESLPGHWMSWLSFRDFPQSLRINAGIVS
jgi:hypothetical protein